MQVSVDNLDGLSRRLKVVIPADMIENKYAENVQKAAKQMNIAGFRKGKVPTSVVEMKFGSQLRDEVIGELLEQTFRKAVEEQELKIAGMPKVEPLDKYQKGQPFEYEVLFETYPEVELKTLDGENVDVFEAEVQQQDVDTMLDKLRKQNAEWTITERPAQNGDKINIDFDGFVDGEAFEGGKAQGFDLELGSKSMIPGFEDQLLACSIGDEVTINVTFPEDYHAEELKGKPAEFKIKVNQVMASEEIEDLDKLAEKLGIEGGKDKLLEQVQTNMRNELKRAVEHRRKEAVLNRLIEKNEIDIPTALVDEEIKHLQQMALQQLSGGRPMEGLDLSKLNLPRDPYVAEATKRVKLGLLLAEVIKTFEIKPDQDEVRKRVEEIAAMYPEPQKVIEWYYHNKESLSEIESAVIEDKAVASLVEKMVVNQKQASYDEVMNPPAEQSNESEDTKAE